MLANKNSPSFFLNVREWDLDKKEPMKKFNFYSKNIDLGWEAYKLGHMPGKNSTPLDVNLYVWENM